MPLYLWVPTVAVCTFSILGSVTIGVLYKRGDAYSENIFTWDNTRAQGRAGIIAQLLSIVLALLVGLLDEYSTTSERKTMAMIYIAAHLAYHFAWTVYCMARWIFETFPDSFESRVAIASAWAMPQVAALAAFASAGCFYDIDSYSVIFILQFILTAYAVLPDGVGYITK